MTTVCGIKLAKKEPKRDPSWASDEKHMGPEPVWDTDRAMEMNDAQFDHFLGKSLNYYNYFYTPKDLKKYVVAWIKAHPKVFTDDEVALYVKSSDTATPMTVCSLIKATTVGMPLREKHRDYIIAKLKGVIAAVESDVDDEVKLTSSKKVPYVPTIQERMAEKVSGIIGEIEGEIDLIFAGKPPKIKVYDYITANKLPQASVGKCIGIFTKKKEELQEALTDKGDLKEGYRYLTKKDITRVIEYCNSVISELEQYAQVKRAQKKVRVSKTPSKDKVVAKLKYLAEDKTLKLVSIPPAAIIGAQMLFVYNVRTRKLGMYIADSHSGSLSVKGTSIVGFDESKSICKTLRKPEVALKEFMSAGKVQARKFLDSIKAVDTKLNGRISTDILLLKVQ